MLVIKKGMLKKKGARNLEHLHLMTTPQKMVTRSKAAKLDVGGIRCNKCGKTKLESKMFSLERLYTSSPVEISESQANNGTKKNFGSKKIMDPKKFLVHL